MKKTHLFLFLLFAAFALGSCKKDGSEPDNFVKVNITSSLGDKSFTASKPDEDFYLQEYESSSTLTVLDDPANPTYSVILEIPDVVAPGAHSLLSANIVIRTGGGATIFSSTSPNCKITFNQEGEDVVGGSFVIPQITTDGKTASATGTFRVTME